MSTHNLCFEQEYEKYLNFVLKIFNFSMINFSVYLNRHVFVMIIDLGQRSDTEKFCFILSSRDNHIIFELFTRCLTLSLPQAMIIGFCKQHRSR